MKNKGILCLIFLTCLVVGFAAGFFTGRNVGHSDIQLSVFPQQSTETDPSSPSTPTDPSEPGIVNINTANLEELMTLPNIGQVLAQRIIDYRNAHGPFTDITELTKVEGIGTKTLEKIIDRITAGG